MTDPLCTACIQVYSHWHCLTCRKAVKAGVVLCRRCHEKHERAVERLKETGERLSA